MREKSHWGAAGGKLLRLVPPAYADSVGAPAGPDRPNPRTISNIVVAEPGPLANPKNASAFLWQWGQFLDHDLDLTEGNAEEPLPVSVLTGDPWFDPRGEGGAVIMLFRSRAAPGTGTDTTNPRQQMSAITAWIDASNVYGSDPERAAALRTNDGSGRLRTSEGDLLPLNLDGLPNDGRGGTSFFLAGDVRANEQVGLLAMHTLFVREHNRLADVLRRMGPRMTGEEIYQRARELVAAEMQVITYREFLPLLLGDDALAPYEGFRPEVDPSISNLFATAAFRLGHSMLNETLLRLQPDGRPIAAGNLPLAQAFFAPERFRESGLEPILRGLAFQRARRIDPYVTDAVRNFLFGPPGAGGFDLASLNIQRGRDHGLADYNTVREALGLGRARDFRDISADPEIRRRLEEAYGTVDQIDPWVGGLAEDPLPGALVGPLFFTILKDQFERLRDGDRWWYQNAFGTGMQRQLEHMTLSRIIRLNTRIDRELPEDVFRAPADAPF